MFYHKKGGSFWTEKSVLYRKKGGHFQTGEQGWVPFFPLSEGAGATGQNGEGEMQDGSVEGRGGG